MGRIDLVPEFSICNTQSGSVKNFHVMESVLSNAISGTIQKPHRIDIVRFCIEALSIPAVMIIHRLFYNLSGFLLDQQTRDFGHLLETQLDGQIPYVPVFVIPYLLTWVFGVLVFLYVIAYRTYDVLVFRSLYVAVLAGTVLEFTIWQILPASISLRVPADVLSSHGWLGAMTGYVYENATVWNVFPSAHISHAGIAWIFSRHFALPRHQFMFFTAFVVICLSVVFIRNHYVVDILSGVLITFLIYRFIFSPVLKSETLERISSASWLAMAYGLCGAVMLGTYIIMGNAWSL